jgi:hypothetical protein
VQTSQNERLDTYILSAGTNFEGTFKTNSLWIYNDGCGSVTNTITVSNWNQAAFSLITPSTKILGAGGSASNSIQYSPKTSTDKATIYVRGVSGTFSTNMSAVISGYMKAVPEVLTLYVTNATLTAPFYLYSDSVDIPGKLYISQTVDATSPTVNSGRAVYSFNIRTAGTFYATAEVDCWDDTQNEFYWNMGPAVPPVSLVSTQIWDTETNIGWYEKLCSWRGTNIGGRPGYDQFKPKTFQLSTGLNQIVFGGKQANSWLGTVQIVRTNSIGIPVITQQPTGSNWITEANMDNFCVSIQADGQSPLYYIWQLKHAVSGTGWVDEQIGTNPAYCPVNYWSAPGSDDPHMYRCIASNSIGTTISSVARLYDAISTAAPLVQMESDSDMVFYGRPYRLDIWTFGGNPLTYRWQNNHNANGSTNWNTVSTSDASNYSYYNIPAVTYSAAYRTIVSNAYGCVTSAPISLICISNGVPLNMRLLMVQ